MGEIATPYVEMVVGFREGYIAANRGDAWYSADGSRWRMITLPKPTGGPVDIASDGDRVILVGSKEDPGCDLGQDTGSSCPATPVSWWSDDGVTWHASAPTKGVDPIDYDEFSAVWTVPGRGWDASMSTWGGAERYGSGLWHTDTGESWQAEDPIPPADVEGSWNNGTASVDGLRIAWKNVPAFDGPVVTLAASTTARDWDVLPFPGNDIEVFTGLPAHRAEGDPWVLGGIEYDAGPVLRIATDLESWTPVRLPTNPGFNAPVEDMVRARTGYVAVSQDFDGMDGNHETWISPDGRDWSVLPRIGTRGRDFGPGRVAWGPAGVLGFGTLISGDSEVVFVWDLR